MLNGVGENHVLLVSSLTSTSPEVVSLSSQISTIDLTPFYVEQSISDLIFNSQLDERGHGSKCDRSERTLWRLALKREVRLHFDFSFYFVSCRVTASHLCLFQWSKVLSQDPR